MDLAKKKVFAITDNDIQNRLSKLAEQQKLRLYDKLKSYMLTDNKITFFYSKLIYIFISDIIKG
jgi:hypothetical protein